MSAPTPSIGIIGSGFGALGTAVELLEAGYPDVRLWERAEALGGVWRDNTYPGAGCDVPSPLYSFSFAVNRRWSRRYARQPEILAYLERVADEYDLRRRIRFGHEVVAAAWDSDAGEWEVRFASGGTDRVTVLISAVGQLSDPVMPSIPGIEEFTGEQFHSAQWDHSVDLAGKRVASIGSGASAVQYVPRVADVASRVVMFQRTPNHIIPKPDGPLPRPWARTMMGPERLGTWLLSEQFARGLTPGTLMAKFIDRLARTNLHRAIEDPELRRKLTPTYPIGCKRILFSNEFYPTLAKDHVDVVTDSIERITPTGIRTVDGVEHEVDVIVHGTGFASQDFLSSIDVAGEGGMRLADAWKDGAHAYLGMYVPGFPNLFVSYGPNTNLGGGSIIYMLEAQARHMRQVLDRMGAGRWTRVEVREEAERRFDEDLQAQLQDSVWAKCDNWYTHPSGRITSNWPGATKPFERATRDLVAEDFAWT